MVGGGTTVKDIGGQEILLDSLDFIDSFDFID
jgi:hypothetical protein